MHSQRFILDGDDGELLQGRMSMKFIAEDVANGVQLGCPVICASPLADTSACRILWTPSELQGYKIQLSPALTFGASLFDISAILNDVYPEPDFNLLNSFDYFTAGYDTYDAGYFLFSANLDDSIADVDIVLPLFFYNQSGSCQEQKVVTVVQTSERTLGDPDLVPPATTTISKLVADDSAQWPVDDVQREVQAPHAITWTETLTNVYTLTFSNGVVSLTLSSEYKMTNIKEHRLMAYASLSPSPRDSSRSWSCKTVYSWWGSSEAGTSFKAWNADGTLEVGPSNAAGTIDPSVDGSLNVPKIIGSTTWSATVPDPDFKTDPDDVTFSLPRTGKTCSWSGWYYSISIGFGLFATVGLIPGDHVGPGNDSTHNQSPTPLTILRDRT